MCAVHYGFMHVRDMSHTDKSQSHWWITHSYLLLLLQHNFKLLQESETEREWKGRQVSVELAIAAHLSLLEQRLIILNSSTPSKPVSSWTCMWYNKLFTFCWACARACSTCNFEASNSFILSSCSLFCSSRRMAVSFFFSSLVSSSPILHRQLVWIQTWLDVDAVWQSHSRLPTVAHNSHAPQSIHHTFSPVLE